MNENKENKENNNNNINIKNFFKMKSIKTISYQRNPLIKGIKTLNPLISPKAKK